MYNITVQCNHFYIIVRRQEPGFYRDLENSKALGCSALASLGRY